MNVLVIRQVKQGTETTRFRIGFAKLPFFVNDDENIFSCV